MERLGEKIGKHDISGTILDPHLIAANVVRDEEVPDVDVFCVLGTGTFSIVGKEDAALIVLIDNVVLNGEALRGEEKASPEDNTDGIVNSNKLSLCGASCVEFLVT